MPSGTTKLPALNEPKAGRLNIQYAPTEASEVAENPPRFSWLPVIEAEAQYMLRVSSDPAFPKGKTQIYTDLPLNFFTPPAPLEPGELHWSYAVCPRGPLRLRRHGASAPVAVAQIPESVSKGHRQGPQPLRMGRVLRQIRGPVDGPRHHPGAGRLPQPRAHRAPTGADAPCRRRRSGPRGPFGPHP